MSSDVVVRCLATLSVHQRKKELPCFLTASVSVGKLSLSIYIYINIDNIFVFRTASHLTASLLHHSLSQTYCFAWPMVLLVWWRKSFLESKPHIAFG